MLGATEQIHQRTRSSPLHHAQEIKDLEGKPGNRTFSPIAGQSTK